jgi:DNA-binding MarR family transcriptional regulator
VANQRDPTLRVLDELGRVVRHLTRISGGPDEGPAMTATQRLALFELVEDGPMRLNDLASRLGISAPTASRAVDALAEAGLVERLTDPRDRRALHIELTPEGRERVERRRERVASAFRPAAAGLTKADRAQLADLLARLASELSDAAPTGVPDSSPPQEGSARRDEKVSDTTSS